MNFKKPQRIEMVVKQEEMQHEIDWELLKEKDIIIW